jgi:hypothetical protein
MPAVYTVLGLAGLVAWLRAARRRRSQELFNDIQVGGA